MSAAEWLVANVTLYGRGEYGQLWLASTVGRGTTFDLTLLDSVT